MKSMAELQPIVERLQKRVGITGRKVKRRIEAGALVKFARATGQTDPLYLDEEEARRGPYGALIAAPTYLSIFTNETMEHGLFASDLPFNMFLHTEDAVELGAPIRAGDEITGIARYAEAYAREGRNGPLLFQVAELVLTNQHDEQVALLRISSVSLDVPEGKSNG